MASGHTLYQDEYCGFGGSGGGGGDGGAVVGKCKRGSSYAPCSKSYEKQPVGGIAQARAEAAATAAMGYRAIQSPGGAGTRGMTVLPRYDADHVATVYSQADRGTHRVRSQWQDPRWTEPTRAANSTLYEPADRDPCNRNNFYTYRSTMYDPMGLPCQPLAVPDVHKLRYMQNNYMTPDDWY